jgi:tetratricopeptide (TPR) repeat protein
MNVRAKSRRRLTILLLVVLSLTCVGGGGYLIRRHQIERRVALAYAQGTGALKAGRYYEAMQLIGSYVQRHGDHPEDAEALYRYAQAREHVEEPGHKHLVSAASFYQRALNLQSDNKQIRHSLMDLYLKMGFNTEAVSNADELLKSTPNDLDALRVRTLALHGLRRYDESRKAADAHNRLDPRDFEVQSATIDLMLRQGSKPKELLDYAGGLVKSFPDDPQVMLVQAIAFDAAGDAASFKAWLQKSAAAAPVANSRFVLALLVQLDRAILPGEAMAVLKKAAQPGTDPDLRRIYISRLWQSGQGEQVITQTAGLGPSDRAVDSELLGMRAMAMLSLGREAEAQPILSALAGRRSDELAAVWVSTLPILYARPQPPDKQIIAACQAALQTTPRNPYFHYAMAQAYERVGDPETAIAHFEAAAFFAPQWVAPLVQLSQALLEVGRFDRALGCADLAQKRDPSDNNGKISYAVALDLQVQTAGELDALFKTCSDVQKKISFEEKTLPIQVRVLVMMGKKQEAMDRLNAALHASPPPSEKALIRLAAISHSAQLGSDEQCFQKSEKQYGLTPELALARAQWYLQSGKSDQAKSSFEQGKVQSEKGDPVAWRIAEARLLELTGDKAAAAAWKALGEQHPDDVKVQWSVLRSRAVQADPAQHPLVGRTIDNLVRLIGEEAFSLKLARARWLLQENGENQTVEASKLLNEVMRTAPDLLEVRLMQAAAFERLNNFAGAAEQLKIAVALNPLKAPPGRPAPGSIPIALELARVLNDQKNFAEARVYLDAVVQQQTNLTPAERFQAAVLLDKQKDAAAALALLDAEQQSTPTLLWARLLREVGKNDRAEEVYRKLLEHPDATVIDAAIGFYLTTHRAQEAQNLLALLDKVASPPGATELVRAGYYSRMGDADKALENFRAATHKAPDSVTAWHQYVGYLLLLGRGQAAVDAAREAATHGPKDKGIASILANASFVTLLSDDAMTRAILIAMLGADEDTLPDIILATHTIADARRNNLQLDKLVPKVREIGDRRPSVLALQLYLIACYAQLQRPDDVYTIGDRAVRLFPGVAEPARMTAVGLAALSDPNPTRADPRRWDDIENFAQKWRQASPDEVMAADALIARTALAREQPQRVVEILRPYIDKASADLNDKLAITVLAAYTAANLKIAPPDQTARILEPMLSRSALHRALWVTLATGLIADRNVAAQWLRRVAPLTPTDSFPEALGLAAGWLRLSTAAPEFAPDAHASLDRAALLARDATSLIALGSLEERFDVLDQAETSYRKALQIDPHNLTAGNNLAMVIDHRHGDLAEAERLISDVIAQHSGDAHLGNCYDTLASIQADRRRLPEAIASMKSALEKQPDSIVFAVHIASLFRAVNQLDQMRFWVSKAEGHADRTALDQQDMQQLKSLRASLDQKS